MFDAVIVVVCFGVGRKVCAMGTELVGYLGVGARLVILVPGGVIIGAYLMRPVCAVYDTASWPCAPPAAAAGAPWLVEGGPSVPVTFEIPSFTTGGKVPVMPDKVNRSE